MFRFKKVKFVSLLASVSIIGLITSSVTFAVLSGDNANSSIQNLANSSRSSTNSTNENESSGTKELKSNESIFYPSRINISKPKQLAISTSSLPTFQNGSSNRFSLALNQSTNKPAISFDGTNFSLPFMLDTPTSSIPLNENPDPISENSSNFFIGYQKYSNGLIVNEGNYGSTITQSFDNQTGDQFIAKTTVSNLQNLFVNPNEIAIFSIDSCGVGQSLSNELSILKMYAPLSGDLYKNWSISSSSQKIANSSFYYNLIVTNNGSSYEFFVPEQEQTLDFYYNNQNGNLAAPNSDLTASEYIAYLKANQSELDKFRLVSNNAVSSKNNFSFSLVPDDKNGVISVNVTVNNFLSVTNTNNGYIYQIEPTKTYENVIVFQGFKPDSSVELDFRSVLDLNSVYDPNTVSNSFQIDTISNGFGLSVNSAQLFGVNTQFEKFIYNWPESNGANSNLYEPTYPFDTRKSLKLFDFSNFGNGDQTTINLISSTWSNLFTTSNGSTFYPSISTYSNQNSLNDVRYNFLEPNSSSQWLSISTWENYNQYILNDTYTNNEPIDYKITNIPQPFSVGDQKLYYSTVRRIGDNSASASNNSPIAINLKIRNDDLIGNSSSNKLTLSSGNGEASTPILMDYLIGRYGSNYSVSGNKAFEYLTGVISQVNGVGYWCAPKNDTFITIEDNGGFSRDEISGYLASDFLNNNFYNKKIKMIINGGIANTLSDMTIKAYADDVNGVINVSIIPGVGVESNFVTDNLNNNGEIINEYRFKQLEPIKFQISGFKEGASYSDTTVVSDSLDVSSTSVIPKDSYITYGVNDYLLSGQSVSNFIIDKKNIIIANIVQNCLTNVYDVKTKSPIVCFEGNNISSSLLSQLSSTSISIPSGYTNGYNHLVVNFKLKGTASGGVISEDYKNFQFKLTFAQPKKISTTINPKINLIYGETSQVDCNQIKYLIENYKDEFLSYLALGYRDIDNILDDVSNNEYVEFGDSSNFSLPIKKLNGQEIIYSYEDIPIKRNELIYGYPTDYYNAYLESEATTSPSTDELSPTKWTISNVSINDKSVSFSLNLKYFVNANGFIQYNSSFNSYNGEFLGKSIDNQTTTLAQNIFLSPNSQELASVFIERYKANKTFNSTSQIVKDIGNLLLEFIYDFPTDKNNLDNLAIIEDSIVVNNMEGVVSFDLGLKFAKIQGADYTWKGTEESLFNLGKVTISGFKKVYPTILLDNVVATSFIVSNNANNVPSNYYASEIAENLDLLIQVIKNDALINLPIDANVSLANITNNIIVNNIEGTLTIRGKKGNSSGASINVRKYYGPDGTTNQGENDFLKDKESITISGFKKALETKLESNAYDIKELETLNSYNEQKALNLINSLLIDTPKNFNKDNDIVIKNFTKSPSTNSITFDVYLKYGVKKDGTIVRTNSDDINQMISLGQFKIINFSSQAGDTLALESGTTIVDFNKYISSNYVNFNNEVDSLFDFNNEGKISIKTQIIKKICDSVGSSYPLIVNAPSLNESDVDIKVQRVDNTTGTIRLVVYLAKYYKDGKEFSDSEPKYNAGFMNISGFKILPSEETSIASQNYAVSGYQDKDTIGSTSEIIDIIYANRTSIFNNLPINDPIFTNNPSNANDNPNFTSSNILIGDNDYSLSDGQVSIAKLRLTSYYERTDDERKGKIVWVNNKEKNFGQLNLQGFKNWANTSIASKIDISTYEEISQLANNTPGEILSNEQLLNQVKLLVWEKAIVNKSSTSTYNNIKFNTWKSNNLLGEITFSVSIDNYIENGKQPADGETLFKTLDGDVTVIGFKTASPTNTEQNIVVSNPYDSKYPYELSDDDIKQIILDYSSNVPSTMTINDFSFTRTIVNNFQGTITIVGLRYLKNYYDSYGNLASSASTPFPNITIRNLLSTKSATSIKTQQNIGISSLPVDYLSYINFEFNVKQFIIDNMIIGAPANLTTNDLEISNVVDNNIRGTITLTVTLKKYINDLGALIDTSKDPSQPVLSTDITIFGFGTTTQTLVKTELTIDNKINESPSNFLSSPSYEGELKTLIVNKGITGKWESFSEESIIIEKDKIQSNNSLGLIYVPIYLTEWIDESGRYHSKKIDGDKFVPLSTTITINGFKQVKSTYISEIPTSCNFDAIPDKVDDSELKKFIVNYLVVNKYSSMTSDDIKIVEGSRVNNNMLGRIELKVVMLSNYFDDNGNLSSTSDTKEYSVVLLTRNVASPTTITSTYSITNISSFANLTSYDFIKQDDAVAQIRNELLSSNKNLLLKNLPSEYGYTFNWESDLLFEQVTVDNGEKLYGVPTNGNLLLKIKLNKYMSDENASYCSIDKGDSPKTFEVLLTGFKNVENGTIIKSEATIQGYEDKLASNYISNLTTNSEIANFIFNEENNVIVNWPKRFKENISIISLISDNIAGTITATIKIRDFTDKNGLVYESWSKDYVIKISGFKQVNPTILKDANFIVDGSIGSNLASIINKDQNFNVSANISYSELNIAQLSKNRNFNEIVCFILYSNLSYGKLYNLIENPTPKTEELFNSDFNYNSFANLIRISNNFSYDYVGGTISFDVSLLSYYSSFDGSLVTNSNPLISSVTISGFSKVLTTSIVPLINSTELSNILASDWQQDGSYIQLRKFIFDNLNLFVKNPAYDMSFINIDVESVVADNKQGNLSFVLKLNNYFGADGAYHNDYLTQNVILTGFKNVSGGTSMRNIINVDNEPIFSETSIEQLTPTIIKEALFNYRNGNSLIEPIFINLPDDFAQSNIFVANKDKWTIDYSQGSVIVPITLNRYYDDSGSPVLGGALNFSVILNGFKAIGGPTTVAKTVDVSSFANLSSLTAKEVQAADIQFLMNTDNNFLKMIFNESIVNNTECYLPVDFEPTIDLGSFELLNNEQDKNSRILKFKYNNYFANNETKTLTIVNDPDIDNWATGEVVLTGFKEIKPTFYNSLTWDLSSTYASRQYTGNIVETQLSQYANDVMSQYVDNIYYDNDGVTPLTTIVVNEIIERQGSTGRIVAKVSMKNYVDNDLQFTSEVGNEAIITFIGFNAKDQTLATGSTEIDASEIQYIPSIYLTTTSNLIEELNKERVSGRSYLDTILGSSALTGDVKTQVVDIIGIENNNSIFDKYNPGKIKINDRLGTLEFKVKVINTFTQDGKIDTNPSILKDGLGNDAIIKLKINTGKETQLVSPLNISSSIFDLNNTSANLFTVDSQQASEYILKNINKYISLGDDGVNKQQMTEDKIRIDTNSRLVDQKIGTVSYKITFTEWWSFVGNLKSNGQSHYNNCSDDSVVLYKSDTKTTDLDFKDFSIVDKEKDSLLTYFIIGGAAALVLLVLIIVVGLLFRNRLWTFK